MSVVHRGARNAAPGDGAEEETKEREAQPEEPATLDGYEWLALFPYIDTSGSPPPLDARPLPDPAEALRPSKPRDVASMLAACKDTGRPGISLFLRLLKMLLWGAFMSSLFTLVLRLPSIVAAVVLAAGSPRFPPRNLSLGSLAIAVQLATYPAAAAVTNLRLGRKMFLTNRDRKAFLESFMPSCSPSNMVTWAILARERPRSSLIAHRAGLASCTCAECAGDVNRADAASRFAEVMTNAVLGFLLVPLLLWTPVVSMSSFFWPTPWALSAALCLLSVVPTWIVAAGRFFHTPTIPALRYETKLRVRASVILLDDFLGRLRRLVERGVDVVHTQKEPYRDLCRGLLDSWTSSDRFAPAAATTTVVVQGIAVVLHFVLNAAAGCITAWQLADLASFAVFTASLLVHVAAQNAGVTAVTDVWVQARDALRSLAVDCGPREPRTAIRDNDRVLSGFVERAERFRAKIFGLVVDFGMLRGLAATAVTVAVGLYGILRGAGLRVTLETFCPSD
ncbi:hypothetical protein DFJ74DRAFT_771009 [Hyaloraphidium curvatum]|nr:hypothetical protein DFJ74DRAFT_771009 [Hyaloraphidium curvatum]